MRKAVRKSLLDVAEVDPIEVLSRVHALVKSHWVPDSPYIAADSKGRPCWTTDPQATSFDLLGCFMHVAHEMTGSDVGACDARRLFRKANDVDLIPSWEKGKTRAQVLEALERAMSWGEHSTVSTGGTR